MKVSKSFTLVGSAVFAAMFMAGTPAISDASSNAVINAVDDERGGFSFFVDSRQQLLSTRIRVVGPGDYVHEDRTSGDNLSWSFQDDLPDGVYNWEVWAVTAPLDAPQRSMDEFDTQSDEVADPQDPDAANDRPGVQQSSSQPSLMERIPSRYKNVERQSGRFLVEDGEVKMLDQEETAAVDSDEYEPGIIARVAGTALNWMVPEAQAETFDSDITIRDSNPGVRFDDTREDGNDGDDWRVRGAQDSYYVYDAENLRFPFRVEKDAPSDSLYVRSRPSSSPRVGIGTSTPFDALHVSSSFPNVRLENTADEVSWRLQTTNESRFQVLSNNNVQPFSIEESDNESQQDSLYIARSGNVGMGTNSPERDLHIMGNHIRIEDSNSTWDFNPGSQGLWFGQANPTVFGVMKLQNDADSNSIVADETGVGIGTDSPETRLTVYESAGEDASLLTLSNDGGSRILFKDRTGPETGSDSRNWVFSTHGGGFRINRDFSGQVEMDLDNDGNLTIAGTLTQGSSREIKDNIQSLDGSSVLNQLSELTLAEWSYKNSPDSRHAGPMAEEFHAAFGLGASEHHIAPGDMAGLSLAAAQALHEENQALRDRLESIEEQLASAE